MCSYSRIFQDLWQNSSIFKALNSYYQIPVYSRFSRMCTNPVYITQYPVRWTAQIALHFTPWQTCSFRHQLGFSGKHSSQAAIAQRLNTHISTTVYSQVLIYTAEWTGASVERMKKCPNFETVAKGGLRVWHSTTELPRSSEVSVQTKAVSNHQISFRHSGNIVARGMGQMVFI